jgi:HEPN domain-containing protein
MKVDYKILQRMNDLIALGESVLGTKRNPPSNSIGFDSSINSQDGYQWFTSVQNLLVRVFGAESEHYKNFTQQNVKGLTYSPVYRAQGILKSAKDDYEHGHLFELKKVIEAELFDDFLEQASSLLEAGYYQPAAVIAGCVLEDALRKMCIVNQLDLPERPKLDFMNSALAKAGVYNKLTQKKVTSIADIRNNAAHGNWDEFEKEDVIEAISWINRFMENNYA